jgi:hypothetical protein
MTRYLWYRQIHATSWIVYDGNQAIWEATTAIELLAWLRARGLRAEHQPLRVAVVVPAWEPADCLWRPVPPFPCPLLALLALSRATSRLGPQGQGGAGKSLP